MQGRKALRYQDKVGRLIGRAFKEPNVTEAERRKVAVVDDDHAVRDSLRFLLEVTGHPVETFASTAEFLRTDIEHLACLILDHHMPGMTGLELVETLRAQGAAIPVLLITGSPSPAIAARAAALDVYRVLEKPPSEDELLEFVGAMRA